MADDPKKVTVSATRIDASILPPGFSIAYRLYVMQQTDDLKNIADASNNANDLAYQATIKNEEQDVTLADHESRIASLRIDVNNHELRITINEGNITSLSARLNTAEGAVSSLSVRVGNAESSIIALQGDYVSKSVTASQTLLSPLNVTTSYSVGGTKVIGTRQTGWTAATGTALLGAFNANQAYSASATYTQAEIQALASGLVQARQRIKALEDMARTHGLIA